MKTKIITFQIIATIVLAFLLIPLKGLPQLNQSSQDLQSDYLQGTIVIKVKEGVGPFLKQERSISFGVSSLDTKAEIFGISKLEKRFRHKPIAKNSGLPDLGRIYRIEFDESKNIYQVAAEFAKDPNIEYAELVPVNKPTYIPDDPMYSDQQHLPQIMASEAWDVHKGEDGEEVIVAIVDTGTDWLHPDLTENTWQNLGEDADGDGVTLEYNDGVWERDPDDLNGIDDDGNGYADDLIGWDFLEAETAGDGSNPDPFPHTNTHGTHCAGIAAGRTNNGVGISSVSYNVKYMPLRSSGQEGYINYGYEGIIYAAENGADIISNSWGSPGFSQANQEVIDYATGLGSIVVAAAGNDNTDADHYPSEYAGCISVASVNPNDTRAADSHYGKAVDIAAPGVSILSTIINNEYEYFSGTSMAGPMVAGLIGLIKSYNPDWTNDQLIEQVLGTADDIDDLNPGYENALGSGRINAYHALVDEEVEVPQELKLEFLGVTIEDEDGNGSIAAGEKAYVSFSMRNYAHLVSDDNATFILSSPDPEIEIINGSVIEQIPADSKFEFENIFEFKVVEGAKVHVADFIIEVSSDMPVNYGSETEFGVLVAPSGFLVWDDEAGGEDFSGEYIRDFLIERGYEVTYSTYYPSSFDGFDAIFLSFGNSGVTYDNGGPDQTSFMYSRSVPLQQYLEDGGIVYAEGAPFFFQSEFWEYPNHDEMAALFGVETGWGAIEDNPISKLTGLDGTFNEKMTFNTSNQVENYYIDKIIPAEGATVSFAEENYGNVSVYNKGMYGQSTYYFGYTMADLVDEDSFSSRYNFMSKLMKFFDYPVSNGNVTANFITDKTDVEKNSEVHFTDWSITDNDVEIISWAWDFNEDGEIDSYEENPTYTYSEGGVFDVKQIVFTDSGSDTLVRKDFITVHSGILVFEGQAGANGFSGEFIQDYLEDHWYDEVGYTTKFPGSLLNYDAVFLSFGNTGFRSTTLSDAIAQKITAYAIQGGKIYLEGGDALQKNYSALWTVFGLQQVEDGENNPLTSLSGQEQSIMHGLEFNNTNQLSQRSIDAYTTMDDNDEARVAFVEGDYGTVAAEFDGVNLSGYKAFCMSYAIADLEDGEGQNTRKEMMRRILNFFDVVADIQDPVSETSSHLQVFPNPATNQITIEFSMEQKNDVRIDVFDLSGRLLTKLNNTYQEGINSISLNINNFKTGVYYVRIQTGNEVNTVKWVKAN